MNLSSMIFTHDKRGALISVSCLFVRVRQTPFDVEVDAVRFGD